MVPYRLIVSFFIITLFLESINFDFAKGLSPNSFRSSKLLSNTQKMRKEIENMYVECTGALNNWSYLVRKSVKMLVDDEYIKNIYIVDAMRDIAMQLSIIENSFLICKSELEKVGVRVLDITERIDFDEMLNKLIQNNNENEMVKTPSDTGIEERQDRIKLLRSQYDFLGEVKAGISKFEPKDICYKCNMPRAQLSLIGIVNKLRLVYNWYMNELGNDVEYTTKAQSEQRQSSLKSTSLTSDELDDFNSEKSDKETE